MASSSLLFPYRFRVDFSSLLKDEFRHVDLDGIFEEAGIDAPSESEASKQARLEAGLSKCNEMEEAKALRAVGYMAQQYATKSALDSRTRWSAASGQELERVLGHYGFALRDGVLLRQDAQPLASKSLRELLTDGDFKSVDDEFRRAEENMETDPAAAVLAACAILEAVLRTYIDDTPELTAAPDDDIRSMWKMARDGLGLNPATKEDAGVREILQSLGGLLNGIAKLRSDASSAHGKGRLRFRVESRHAKLAVGAAHAMTAFLIETWQRRRAER